MDQFILSCFLGWQGLKTNFTIFEPLSKKCNNEHFGKQEFKGDCAGIYRR